MKKIFLLFVALASHAHATDVAMNCGQQGFQISAQVGYGLTTASNKNEIEGYESIAGTPSEMRDTFNQNFATPPDLRFYDEYIYAIALDYNHMKPFQSSSAISAGLSLGYKWLLNCNQYSITSNAFVQYSGASMYSDLDSKKTNFNAQAARDDANPGLPKNYKWIQGSIGTEVCPADRMTLTSGPVFGFNFLLAKEFNWGNAGLLLGMKFNCYKLKYFEVIPTTVIAGPAVLANGYMDASYKDPFSGAVIGNQDVSVNIEDYISEIKKDKMATGFTVGFSTNHYISENLSAGLTLFYDMYAPITFDINVLANPFNIDGSEGDTDTNGQMKFQNNTIGFMMNLTYSFGAN